MNELIRSLERHIQHYGVTQLTNIELLNILKYSKVLERKKADKNEEFLSRLEAECCNPNQ